LAQEFYKNCIESQKFISGQISSAFPDVELLLAEDARGKRNADVPAGNGRASDLATAALTREEVLLQGLLTATEGLLEAFRLKRMALEPETPPPAYGA
jgi:hypothetical protein